MDPCDSAAAFTCIAVAKAETAASVPQHTSTDRCHAKGRIRETYARNVMRCKSYLCFNVNGTRHPDSRRYLAGW
jgi:hypothetical protein